MFKEYDRNSFNELNKQHNILALVGNGFDIGALKKYKKGIASGKTTSYPEFYNYLLSDLTNKDNILFKEMKKDKENDKDNWSDFENTLSQLLKKSSYNVSELEKSVDELQKYFIMFLNEVVDYSFILEFNQLARKNKWAWNTLSHFLRDLPSGETKFASKTGCYDLFNFVFVNFNYTNLLENYLYLDKNQFDPHVHKNVDTNFLFYSNNAGSGGSESIWSSYVLCDVIHPHGIQGVPRSLLFGIDLKEYDKGRSFEKKLVKPYWARCEVKYRDYIETAELFIIYGMSLGEMDAWWMDAIYDELLSRDVELIIYMYGDSDEEIVKKKFINSCVRHLGDSKTNREVVNNKIHVVTFVDNTTWFLGFNQNDEYNTSNEMK
ncbi:AbiH family protein [Agathobacter ruminis]|uniref:ABC transporter permease n=1 Tax=Agathobacter ruminis TaxID=1712665 RepID=A0A2G3E729_9FIRM|nr:AbiH family protein [Agathobacter ruminis]MDC7300994.1 bacteriophage abortive infection AbiH family protein [Agathobacter ruminis]PHU38945.1 ABC transporter permease [Agathobacter ruminis]